MMKVELSTWEVVVLVAVIVNDLWNKQLYLGYLSHSSPPLTFLDCMQRCWPKGRQNVLTGFKQPCAHFQKSQIWHVRYLFYHIRPRNKKTLIHQNSYVWCMKFAIRKQELFLNEGADHLPSLTGILQNYFQYLNVNVKRNCSYQR